MVRIRVYPQGYFANGYGNSYGFGYGTRRRSAAMYRMQLQAERQRANMRLQYERALWSQQMKMVQLQGRYGMSSAYNGAYNTAVGPVMYPGALVNPWALNAIVATQLGAEVFNSGNTFWNAMSNVL